jgi:hypothetical protein
MFTSGSNGTVCLAKTSLVSEISSVYKIFLHSNVLYINRSKYPEFGRNLVAWGLVQYDMIGHGKWVRLNNAHVARSTAKAESLKKGQKKLYYVGGTWCVPTDLRVTCVRGCLGINYD